MLDVRELKSLDKQIRESCELRTRTKLKEYLKALNEEIAQDEEFRESVYKAVMKDICAGVYHISTNYNGHDYIRAGACSVYYEHHLPTGKKVIGADICRKHLTGMYDERDKMLDIIYSRPDANELEIVYNYILGGKPTIECAK